LNSAGNTNAQQEGATDVEAENRHPAAQIHFCENICIINFTIIIIRPYRT